MQYSLHKVDESDDSPVCILEGDNTLVLVNPNSAPVDMAVLNGRLRRCANATRVLQLSLARTSMAPALPDMTAFPNLDIVQVHSPRCKSIDTIRGNRHINYLACDSSKTPPQWHDVIRTLKLRTLRLYVSRKRDLELVSSCTSLQRLVALGWGARDLSALHSLRLDRLELGGGKLVEASGLGSHTLQDLMIKYCRQLLRIGECSAVSVDILACPKLDQSTIGNIKGVEELSIYAPSGVNTFDFVDQCKQLNNLFVNGKLRTDQVAPLIRSASLRRIVFPPNWPPEITATIAEHNPRVSIIGGGVAFAQGNPVEGIE